MSIVPVKTTLATPAFNIYLYHFCKEKLHVKQNKLKSELTPRLRNLKTDVWPKIMRKTHQYCPEFYEILYIIFSRSDVKLVVSP